MLGNLFANLQEARANADSGNSFSFSVGEPGQFSFQMHTGFSFPSEPTGQADQANASNGMLHHFMMQYEDLFQQLLQQNENAFQVFFQMQQDNEQQVHTRPTANAVLHSAPTVKVTEYDLENGSDECSVCLEKFALDESALRIPCGHLFHQDCVRKWLQSSNQCPVCRYELPTDDAEYEQGRCERARNQKPRLKAQDLSRRSVQELKYLAHHFGVSIVGCLEKQDVIEAIAASGAITVVQDSTSSSESRQGQADTAADMPSAAEVDTAVVLAGEHAETFGAEDEDVEVMGIGPCHDTAIADGEEARGTPLPAIADGEQVCESSPRRGRRLWAAAVQKVLGFFRRRQSNIADANASLDS